MTSVFIIIFETNRTVSKKIRLELDDDVKSQVDMSLGLELFLLLPFIPDTMTNV